MAVMKCEIVKVYVLVISGFVLTYKKFCGCEKYKCFTTGRQSKIGFQERIVGHKARVKNDTSCETQNVGPWSSLMWC